MKTLHVTNFWHETSGGIATFYRALINAANNRGQQIRLVVPGEQDSIEPAGEFGKIYHVRSPRARLNPQYRVIYPKQFLLVGSRVHEILVAEQPELVEICDKYTLNYLGAILRCRMLPGLDFRPTVVGLSCERMDDNFESYLGQVPLAREFCSAYMKWVYFPFFDHHIANSQYTAEELRRASRGHLTLRNTWVRPMGIDLQHLSPSRKSKEARERILRKCEGYGNSVLLLYAGRLVPEKNLDLLFQTLVHLKRSGTRDYRLLVAGEGIERQRWESFSSERLAGRVFFLGHVADPAELADLLANSDAFVHPNPREPFGIAPLQAMASGLPLVAPNAGGVMTYANSQNAWLAPPDAASFAAAIEELLTNGSLRTIRSQNAVQSARQFGWETAASAFLDLYAELCRAAANEREHSLAPDFASESAKGMELFWSQKASQAAEKTFQLVSALLSPRTAQRVR